MKTLPYLLGHVARPRPVLSTYVHHYEWFEVGEQLQEARISLFPHFSTSLVFIFYHDVPILVTLATHQETELPPCSLLPPLTRPLQNRRIQGLKMFRVIFQPGALYSLYRIPMKTIQNQLLDPREDLDSSFSYLHERMWEKEDMYACISLFENYLLTLLASISQPIPQLFGQVIEIIQQQSDRVKVDHIAADMGIDRTTLAKHMKKELGFRTIQFISLYKFCEALMQMCQYPMKKLAHLALDCGYNDQAYLSREFKQMTGHSPGRFLRMLRSQRLPQLMDVSFSGLMVKKV